MVTIGIDQSYQDTGIAVTKGGKVKSVIDIKRETGDSNTAYRNRLRVRLATMFQNVLRNSNNAEAKVVFERIRLHSGGFLSLDYIKAMGGLNAVIIDTAEYYGFGCYSADTRAWKAAVVRTCGKKANGFGVNPNKWPTIQWCEKNGYSRYIMEEAPQRKKKGVVVDPKGNRLVYNDNRADAICIALYGEMPDAKLKEES